MFVKPSRFSTPDAWRMALGLLPVPLQMGSDKTFILLNGQSGNFCLDLCDTGLESFSSCSDAWSSNVGHYVKYGNDNIEIQRWDQPHRVEKYTTQSILRDLEKFHKYLANNDPGPDNSIVKHTLKIYRTIRHVLQEEKDGFSSLKVFLLLISAASDRVDLSNVDPSVSGVPQDASSILAGISGLDLERLIFQIEGHGSSNRLSPNYSLMLRHASGTLFQEAHFQAKTSLQMWLPGFGPATFEAPQQTTSYDGVYFTPQTIARTLAEEAVRHLDLANMPTVSVFDPTCGSGELLKEALRILEMKGFTGKIILTGWDSSSAAIDMARFTLTFEGRSWTPGQVGLNLSVRDSLVEKWPDDVDVLLMNPPFKSWQLMEKNEQELTNVIMGDMLRYKPNMASLFTALAINCLKRGGVIAMVSPCSLFDAHSASKLREKIVEEFSIKFVAKLGNQNLFFNAMVDAGLFVGKKEDPTSRSKETILAWADHSKEAVSKALRTVRKTHIFEVLPAYESDFSVYRDVNVGVSSSQWMPRPYLSWLKFTKASHAPNSIPASKAFDIKQGARLGNDIFIVSKSYYHSLPESERLFFRPAVTNLSVQNASLVDTHYVFFPYGTKITPLTDENLLRQHVPTYYNQYLLAEQAKLRKRKYIEGTGNWWDLARPCTWQFEPDMKLVSKYFGKHQPFAIDTSGDYAAVVGNAWMPKAQYFHNQSANDFIYAIFAYLNSGYVEEIIDFISAHVGGGQCDLGKKYLASLPIPNLTALPANQLAALTDFGLKLHNGEPFDQDDLDGLCESVLLFQTN